MVSPANHAARRCTRRCWLGALARSPQWSSPICISTTAVSRALCPLPRMCRRPSSRQRRHLATRCRTGRTSRSTGCGSSDGDEEIAEGIRLLSHSGPYAGSSIGCDRSRRRASGTRCAVRLPSGRTAQRPTCRFESSTTEPGREPHRTRCNASGRSHPFTAHLSHDPEIVTIVE